jgi:hypothetical protein
MTPGPGPPRRSVEIRMCPGAGATQREAGPSSLELECTASVRSKAADAGRALPETCRSLPAVSAGIRTCRGSGDRPGPNMGSCADGAGHRPEDSGAAAALTGTGDPVARPHRHPVPRTPASASTRRWEVTACSISRHGLLHRRRSLAGPRAACGRHDGAQAIASMGRSERWSPGHLPVNPRRRLAE